MAEDKVHQKIKELAEAVCDEEPKLDFADVVMKLEDTVYSQMEDS